MVLFLILILLLLERCSYCADYYQSEDGISNDTRLLNTINDHLINRVRHNIRMKQKPKSQHLPIKFDGNNNKLSEKPHLLNMINKNKNNNNNKLPEKSHFLNITNVNNNNYGKVFEFPIYVKRFNKILPSRQCMSLVFGMLSPPLANSILVRNGNYTFLSDPNNIIDICTVSLKQNCSYVRDFSLSPPAMTEHKHFIHVCEQTWDGYQTYQALKYAIDNKKPFLMGKLGQTEYAHVAHWYHADRGRHHYQIWPLLYEVAGVYPLSQQYVSEWVKIYYKSSQLLDIVMRWTDDMRENNEFNRFLYNKDSIKVNWVQPLWPWYWSKPYTELLVGKTVLIVSPFGSYIKSQYNKNRTCIYPNTNVLPEFKLKTYLAPLPPVVSVSRKSDKYQNINFFNNNSWIKVYNELKYNISTIDYDIMIIGAGAFGLPIAANAKRNGKIAIVLGGNVGPLFGLKGGRFDNREVYRDYFYNKCWLRMEKPPQAAQMEGSAYW